MKGLCFVGGLLIGAAAGVFVGIKISEKKMADKVNEEVDKIRETYISKEEQPVKKYNREIMINKPSVTELAKELHYIPEETPEEDEGDDFELIADSDFGEYDDFDMVTLYMENGELKDLDTVNPPEVDQNLEKYVNSIRDSIDCDSIYIRDGSNMRDYEVIFNDSPMEG